MRGGAAAPRAGGSGPTRAERRRSAQGGARRRARTAAAAPRAERRGSDGDRVHSGPSDGALAHGGPGRCKPAFDWLKCIYWDSQTDAIPDAQVELRSRLHEIDQFLKGKDSKKEKSGSKRKRSEKLISKTINYVCRFYHACPSEVVSVLLDFFQLDAPESSENSDVHQTDSLDVNQPSDVQNQISKSDIKTIIIKLSEKEPRLLLGILKLAIEMIETGEGLENKGESYACLPAELEPSKMKNLCSLVLWLPVFSLDGSAKESTLPESRIIPNEQESVEKATERLEMFKLQLKERKNACLLENGTEGSFNTSTPGKCNRWSITKSWTPCPIGMIPCSFSSTAVLPALDVIGHELKDDTLEQHGNLEHDDHTEMFDYYSHPKKQLDDECIPEISRSPPECRISDMPELTFPLKGRLLVGGVWKNVTEEDLLFIKSKMKILL